MNLPDEKTSQNKSQEDDIFNDLRYRNFKEFHQQRQRQNYNYYDPQKLNEFFKRQSKEEEKLMKKTQNFMLLLTIITASFFSYLLISLIYKRETAYLLQKQTVVFPSNDDPLIRALIEEKKCDEGIVKVLNQRKYH